MKVPITKPEHICINLLPTFYTNLAVSKDEIAGLKLLPTKKIQGKVKSSTVGRRGSQRKMRLTADNIIVLEDENPPLKGDGSLDTENATFSTFKEKEDELSEEAIDPELDHIVQEYWAVEKIPGYGEIPILFTNKVSHPNLLQQYNSQNPNVHDLVHPNSLTRSVMSKMNIKGKPSTWTQLRSILSSDTFSNDTGMIEGDDVLIGKIVEKYRKASLFKDSGDMARVGIDDVYQLVKNQEFGSILNAKLHLAPRT